LSLESPKLTNIDVSNNTALTSLSISSTLLTSLDVSNNTALTTLNCSTNQLTSLDVSNNIALTTLYCHNNQLTSLDVGNNTALTYLWCGNNQLSCIQVNQTQLNAIPTNWSKDADASYSIDCSNIQGRLDSGETPYQIYQSDNSLLESLYGKNYQGGLIFYLNTTNGSGMIAAPNDLSSDVKWGCIGTYISSTSNSNIGAGSSNTSSISSACDETSIAAEICDNVFKCFW